MLRGLKKKKHFYKQHQAEIWFEQFLVPKEIKTKPNINERLAVWVKIVTAKKTMHYSWKAELNLLFCRQPPQENFEPPHPPRSPTSMSFQKSQPL